MPILPDPRFDVTAEEILDIDWEAELSKTKDRDCDKYYNLLFAKAEQLRGAGEHRRATVFDLLGTVAVMHPNYENRHPYEWEANRPDGPRLGQKDLATLALILGAVRDPEFRAKMADVIWELRQASRGLDLARTAIDAFLQSAECLEESDNWVSFVTRIERALQLASKVHRGKELQLKVLGVIEDKCVKYAPDTSSGLLCCRLMDLLIAHDLGEEAKYAALATQLAEANEAIGDWRFAHKYWTRASEWHRRAKDETSAREAFRRCGEAHVSLAEANILGPQPNAGFAAYWIAVGRQELERAAAPAARLEQLQRRMLELQANHAATMRPIDLPDHVVEGANEAVRNAAVQAKAFVAGLDLPHALYRLAIGIAATNAAELRKKVEADTKEFIYTSIVGQTIVSPDGRPLASSPPLTNTPSEERDAVIEREMWTQAKQWNWWFRAAGMIQPARDQIFEEHRPSLVDLAFLVFHNEAVPPGRERFFARGLLAGFYGDWTVALSLLVPQIENALRHVLSSKGVITSTIKADRSQPELSLDWLLTREKTQELLGPGMVFDLRGLLTSKFGHNLRNDIAHGLAQVPQLKSPSADFMRVRRF